MLKYHLSLLILSFIAINLTLPNFSQNELGKSKFDVTVIGCTDLKEMSGQIAMDFIGNFQNELKLNFIGRTNSDLSYLKNDIRNIVEDPYKTPGKIAISFGLIHEALLYMPESPIKISYSFFETNRIPDEWVNTLNKHFDAVAVPSKFLVKAYQKSGVNIPIFFLPVSVNLRSLYKHRIKNNKKIPFVFYSTRSSPQGSNHELLLNAFLNKFSNNPNVILKLYIKNQLGVKRLYEIINTRKANNVEIILANSSQKKYIKCISSANCYVSVSKCECFLSNILEALALEIPCILSNNTVHKELPHNPCITLLKSRIKEPGDYRFTFGKYIGHQFNTLIDELEFELQKIYDNYKLYNENTNNIKEFINKRTIDYLGKKYINLIKPKKVILGPKNKIACDYIMTNSKELYNKYLINVNSAIDCN